MVAKGHDVPGVTLVGVLLADASLNFPDFRSAERTFQVLTQVAGRAGRGEHPGRVILQTYSPQHYAIRAAARHDFSRFATQELRYRQKLGYPPFTRLIGIRIEGKEKEQVEAAAGQLAERFLQVIGTVEGKAPVVLGPAPAPVERIQGRERWQILLKGEDRQLLHALVKQVLEEKPRLRRTPGLRIIVDVDPYSML
jgi:primosomal protein N' (replication factor Y)